MLLNGQLHICIRNFWIFIYALVFYAWTPFVWKTTWVGLQVCFFLHFRLISIMSLSCCTMTSLLTCAATWNVALAHVFFMMSMFLKLLFKDEANWSKEMLMYNAPSPCGMVWDPNGVVLVGSKNDLTGLWWGLHLTSEPELESKVPWRCRGTSESTDTLIWSFGRPELDWHNWMGSMESSPQ